MKVQFSLSSELCEALLRCLCYSCDGILTHSSVSTFHMSKLGNSQKCLKSHPRRYVFSELKRPPLCYSPTAKDCIPYDYVGLEI